MTDAHILNLKSREGVAFLIRHRNAIIEECARIAELKKWHNYAGDPNKVIAAAIRALKDRS